VNLASARELDELVAAIETVPLVVVDCRAASTDLFLAYFAELAVFDVLKSMDAVLTVVSPINHDLDSVEQVRILPSYGIRHAVRTEPWQPVGSAHSCSSSSHHLELSGAGERPASRNHRSAIATRPRSPVARITCAHWMSSRLARRRIRKSDLLSHCRRVLVTQMTVRLHCQCAAVFVSQPAAHRWDVDTRFNAPRGKKVPKVVMGDPGQAELLAGGINGLLTFTNPHDRCIHPLFFSAFRTDALQEPSHIRDHRDAPNFPILCSGGRIPLNRDLPFLEVTVVPMHACRLAFPTAAIREKLGEVPTTLAKPASR